MNKQKRYNKRISIRRTKKAEKKETYYVKGRTLITHGRKNKKQY